MDNDIYRPFPERLALSGGYRLAKVKTLRGREGYAFEGELHLNGKRIATVSNDGNGGPNRVDFDGATREERKAKEDAVAALVATHPEDYRSKYEPVPHFIGTLFELDEELKLIRKRVKAGDFVALIPYDTKSFEAAQGAIISIKGGAVSPAVLKAVREREEKRTPGLIVLNEHAEFAADAKAYAAKVEKAGETQAAMKRSASN